jgi:phosphate-selective porin OprO/OprP
VPIDGYYVMATYLLTGEQRTEYSQQIAPLHAFNPCAPLASPGAWEFVFRADRLEVGSQAFAGGAAVQLASTSSATNQSSSAAFETTTGLNWYLNKWARMQFNWEHADFANPIKTGNMTKALSEEDALYTRFQVIF